jgi:hypothetical protein
MNTVVTPPQLGAVLAKVWHNVVRVVNKLLETHQKFGYAQFQEELNPSLPEILEGFKQIDAALTVLMDTGLLTYDEFRAAINSKQCILQMKLLSGALEADAEPDYERIIAELDAQPKF